MACKNEEEERGRGERSLVYGKEKKRKERKDYRGSQVSCVWLQISEQGRVTWPKD